MEKQDELLARASAVIRDLREKLVQANQRQSSSAEPIAIVGMACRFPGRRENLEGFWETIGSGFDAITRVPRERWNADTCVQPPPAAPDTKVVGFAGFLRHIDLFDAGFFDISPREAISMDPQQRLLLEVAWHAFEDAGLLRQDLAGSETGVFVGVHHASSDYQRLQPIGECEIDIYSATGICHDVIAGRLAYLFDLRGPSLVVNTACSSSLVAVHLARRSLLAGDCRTAVAAGLNLILKPDNMISVGPMNILAPDGRSRAFDASSDGFGRGEGCGVVILKRLSDAVASHDRIYAVIRGSALNQDGRTNGLTAPNGLAQRAVVQKALAEAGVKPEEIGYIETHGTGTKLGDPIEVEALAETVGKPGAGTPMPCVLGAVKASIGHLEGGAGIAGLIKTALVLRNRYLPPVALLKELNPHLQIGGTRLEIPKSGRKWTSNGKRRAGVSSFGWCGTNAHAVLEEAQEVKPRDSESRPGPCVVAVSGSTPEALVARAKQYAAALDQTAVEDLADFAYTASVRRTPLRFRWAAIGSDPASVASILRAKIASAPNTTASLAEVVAPAFLYPDLPAGGWSDFRPLLDREPIFRDGVTACATAIRALAGWDLLEELARPEADSRLIKPAFGQPAWFAIQCGLTELLRRKWKVEPGRVAGIGLGEISAAWAAGALTLDDATRVALQRGRFAASSSKPGSNAAAEMAAALSGVRAANPSLPVYSTLDGELVTAGGFYRPEYWGRNLVQQSSATQPVIDSILAESVTTFLGIGSDAFRPAAGTGRFAVLPSANGVLDALACVFEAGHNVDWKPFCEADARLISLPEYPFQRRRYWIDLPNEDGVTKAPPDWFYQSNWIRMPEGAASTEETVPRPKPHQWAVLGNDRDSALAFAGVFGGATADKPVGIATIEELPAGCAGIVDIRALDPSLEHEIERAERLTADVTELARALVDASKVGRAAKLWIITRGAVSVSASETPSCSQAALWGFGSSIAIEHPEIWGGLIDLDPAQPSRPSESEGVWNFIRTNAAIEEDQVAFRNSARFVPRLERLAGLPSISTLPIQPDATYLVTGAFGGIGVNIASWLASRGAKNLVLLSRSGKRALEGNDPATLERARVIESLEAQGVAVRIEECDIADDTQSNALFADLDRTMPPVRGIVHAAADIRLRPLEQWTRPDIRAAFRSKVTGALILGRAATDLKVDFLILFSSISCLLGGADSSVYAAANRSLEALAVEHRHRGVPATAVSWGLWDVSSHVVEDAQAQTIFKSGFRAMAPAAALDGMEQLAAWDGLETGLGVVVDMDWRIRKPAIEFRGRKHYLDEIPAERVPEGKALEKPPSDDFRQRFDKTPPAARPALLIDLICSNLRRVFRLGPTDPIDVRRGFFEMGLDSLMSVDLKNRLETGTGLAFSGTLTLNYPNVTVLAAHLLDKLQADPDRRQPGSELKEPATNGLAQVGPSLAGASLDVASLSDSEVSAALAAELSELSEDLLQ